MRILFRESVSDQVICCAPVSNSQIQSGMSSELTCSSFHSLANRSVQRAENQYRVMLKIVYPNRGCPLNNNTAVGQNAKSIKWTSYSIRSSALDHHCNHLSPVYRPHRNLATPGGNPYRAEGKERNQKGWKTWTSRPSVAQTHQPYLLHAHVGNRHRGHVLRFDLHFTLDFDPNLTSVD